MKPKTAAALGLAASLALASLGAVSAQTAPDAPKAPDEAPTTTSPETPQAPESPIVGEEGTFSPNPFLRGEQTISLGAGLHIPLFILPGSADKLELGGAFSFGYQYFIARGLAIGGTIAGAFNGTLAGRSLFVAPLSFRTAYWWSIMPFEVDVAVEAGGYLSRLSGSGMLGPFAKVGGGAYWRTTSSWSLGLQTYLWLVPEIHWGDYSDYTRTGGLLEVSASAVYHL
jgi:hypothetical protein